MRASEFDHFPWSLPWQRISSIAREAYELELRTELCPDHMLHDLKCTAIARTCNGDDVLFLVDKHPKVLAVVHLTFTGRREANPLWPTVRVFASMEKWVNECLQPDIIHYRSEDARKSA